MFEVGKRYNFTTIDPVTLGSEYRNMKVLSIMNFDLAIKFTDIMQIRNKIIQTTGISLLPERDVQYVMFENEYGKTTVLAVDWINPDSVQLVDTVKAQITIDNIDTTTLTTVRNLLQAMGLKIDISTYSVG